MHAHVNTEMVELYISWVTKKFQADSPHHTVIGHLNPAEKIPAKKFGTYERQWNVASYYNKYAEVLVNVLKYLKYLVR